MMLENFSPFALLAMAELTQLRAQALDLFDRCLVEGNTAPIIAFVERQVTNDPPQLQLLRDFSADVQQRLLSLRAYHYDVRKNVVLTFSQDYAVDITPVVPPGELDQYHLVEPYQVLAYAQAQGAKFSDQDLILLGKLLEASVKTAARLQSDIQLTTELQNLVLDWFDALSSTMGRRYWANGSNDTPSRSSAVH
jgi:hypothetical protein